MRTLIAAFLFSVTITGFLAAEEQDAPGYTDTPLLPNSQWRVHDKTRPQPVKVKPGTGDLGAAAPSDAAVLFNGTSLEHWKRWQGKDTPLGNDLITDGCINILKTGFIQTKEDFGDFQLHLEWQSPAEEAGKNDRMNWGNSGVNIMGMFEIQILESCDSHIYADGNAGALYGQYPPMVNPARKPGEWQSYEIFFTAPKWQEGKMIQPAYVTVVYNGVLVLNHVQVLGSVQHKRLPGGYPKDKMTGPIVLMEHKSAVKFRNIWIRRLVLP